MHSKKIDHVFKELNTSQQGLSQSEAQERLRQQGLNEIKEGKKISPLEIFINQFKSIVVWILIVATIISAFLGEYIDTIVILAIIVLIAILGFFEEYRAERAIEALKKLTSLRATVIRQGQKNDIDSKEIVIGDIIVLETGDKVPADARSIEVFNFQSVASRQILVLGKIFPASDMRGELVEPRSPFTYFASPIYTIK